MKAIYCTLGILLDVCTIPMFIYRCPSDVQVNQGANGVITSCDALADMLESIHYFISRLRIYVETMPAVNKIVVRLMVGLIFTLAVVAQKLKTRRGRESFLTNMLLYLLRRSQICEEFFRG